MEFIRRIFSASAAVAIITLGVIFAFEGARMYFMGNTEDRLLSPTKFGGFAIALFVALAIGWGSVSWSFKVWVSYVISGMGTLLMFGVFVYFDQFVTEPWGDIIEMASIVLGTIIACVWLFLLFEITCRVDNNSRSRI